MCVKKKDIMEICSNYGLKSVTKDKRRENN